MADSQFISHSMLLNSGDKVTSSTSKRTLIQMVRSFAKRVLDILLSAFGLLLLSPFFAIIAWMINRDTPGGVFFWSPRMGRGRKPFKMLKFRTMYEEQASYEGPKVTCKGDKRITPFGCWLRDTKVNELPQLWNVLKGEMSLVGPRPEDPDIALGWPEDASQEILSIRPGITSPASILYHDEESLLSSDNVMESYLKDILPDKMRLDRLYVRHQGFFTDLDIIFWTVVVIIPRLVRTPIPEGYLFAGPVSRFFNRYFTWFVSDLMTSLLAVGAVGLIWRSQIPINWGVEKFAILALGLALLFSGVNSIAGLNRIDWPRATVGDAFSLALAGACVTLLLLVLDIAQKYLALLPLPALPIAMIFTIGIVAFGFSFVTRYRWRILTTIASRWIIWRRDRSGVGERLIIVGSGEGCETATWLLNRERFLYAYTVVGIVDDDVLSKKDMRIAGCRILGRFKDLPELVKKYDVGMVISTLSALPPEINDLMVELAKNSNVRLVYLNKFIKLVDQQFMPRDAMRSNRMGPEVNLEFLATHSELTGLPNTYLFKYQLERSLSYARRYQNNLAVLLIELDGFQGIIKSFGYRSAQEVMREVSHRLARCKRESDMLACLDDTRFALILENVQDCSTVDGIAKRLTGVLSEPVRVDGQVLNLNVSLRSFVGVDVCEESHLVQELPIG